MDIALAVEEIYPAAQFRMCHTYEELVATWTDKRPAPNREALKAAWLRVQAKAEKKAALDAVKETDEWMARIVEDWIVAGGDWASVPSAAQAKLTERLKRRKTYEEIESRIGE